MREPREEQWAVFTGSAGALQTQMVKAWTGSRLYFGVRSWTPAHRVHGFFPSFEAADNAIQAARRAPHCRAGKAAIVQALGFSPPREIR